VHSCWLSCVRHFGKIGQLKDWNPQLLPVSKVMLRKTQRFPGIATRFLRSKRFYVAMGNCPNWPAYFEVQVVETKCHRCFLFVIVI